MKITVRSSRTRNRDPNITLFAVELETDGARWNETYGSKHETQIFLRGVQAGVSMSTGGYQPVPPVPDQADRVSVEKDQ